MGRILAIANQKGGVGKTTTTINLSASLAMKGLKILVVDMDPQGNTTSGLGVDKHNLEHDVYELLIGDCSVGDCLIPSGVVNLDIIPADVNLAGAEIELIGVDNKEYVLRDAISGIEANYDYVIIDCPPSLSLLTINAMTTASGVIVPVQCEFYALEGLSQLISTIDLVSNRLNPSLSIEGIVFTMYDGRTNLSQDVVENVKASLHRAIYDSVIPRNIRLAEAPSHGIPICTYEPRSAGAMAYENLANELLKHDRHPKADYRKREIILDRRKKR